MSRYYRYAFLSFTKESRKKKKNITTLKCPTFWIVQLFQAGQQLEFKCNPGYRLIGERYLTCLDIGIWDHKRPSCTPYGCPLPKQCVLETYSLKHFKWIITPKNKISFLKIENWITLFQNWLNFHYLKGDSKNLESNLLLKDIVLFKKLWLCLKIW